MSALLGFPHASLLLILATFIGTPFAAHADQVPNSPKDDADAGRCLKYWADFHAAVSRINENIIGNSREYSPKTGVIAYPSNQVWARDLRMLLHYLDADFREVFSHTPKSAVQCSAVIEFYSGCVDELYANLTAAVSVRYPKTGCLGRLYETYLLTDDDYYQGR